MENAEESRFVHAIYITETGSVVVREEPDEERDDLDAPVEYADLAEKYARAVEAMG